MNRNEAEVRSVVEKILSRVKCEPWEFQWRRDRKGRVLIWAIHIEDFKKHGWKGTTVSEELEIRSLKAEEILEVAFNAIENGERARIRDRFTYRGRDIFGPRFFAGRNPLSPASSVASLVEEIDRHEQLGTFGPHTFSVNTVGEVTQL